DLAVSDEVDVSRHFNPRLVLLVSPLDGAARFADPLSRQGKFGSTPPCRIARRSHILAPNGDEQGPPCEDEAMPLDDREQRILAEIERQFYEDDPDLVQAVRNIDRSRGFGLRLPVVGLIGGLAIVVAFFTSQTIVALAGFTLMVVSATALVHEIRRRGWSLGDSDSDSDDRSIWPRGPFGRR